jgi:hypothetical protein
VWSDKKTLLVGLGYGATVDVGDVLALEDNILRSADGFSEFGTDLMALAVAPASPPVPTAVITGPERIGNCESLDLVGDMSTGNAGRALTFKWSVVPNSASGLTPEEYTAINKVVNAAESSTLEVEPDLLIANREYEWRLQVTNWLGRSHAITVSVFKARGAVPKIQFDDSATRYIRKDESFLAVVKLEASACDPTQELRMGWTQVTDHDFTLPESYSEQVILSQNKMFYLDKNTLSAGLTYVFRISVAIIDDTSLSNTADLTIIVASSPVQAGIVGGDRLQSILPGDIILDASESVDPDDPLGEGMAYLWSCAFKSRGQACFSAEAMSNQQFVFVESDSPVLVVPRGLLRATVDMQVPNFEGVEAYVFTVVVSKTGRTAFASVSVKTTEESVPGVTITVTSERYGDKKKVMVDKKLYIESRASSDAVDPDWDIQWTCTTDNFDMIQDNFATPLTSSTLVFKAGVLYPGVVYTFMVEYTNANSVGGKTGQATVAIETNAPPRSGTCFAEPRVGGRALQTEFTFKCIDWADDDSPLQFKYSIIQNDAVMELGVFNGKNSLTPELVPEGPQSNNHIHTIRASIMDSLASTTVYDFEVQVLPMAEDVSVDDALDQMAEVAANAAASGDSNSYAQSFYSTTTLLNKVRDSNTNGRRLLLLDGGVAAEAQTRSQLLDSLELMVDNSYATTTDSVQQQAQLTREVCSNPSVLSAEALLKCAQFAEEAAAKVSNGDVAMTTETAQAVLDTFASVLGDGQATSSRSAGGRRRLLSESIGSDIAGGFKAAVGSMAQGLLVGCVPREDATSVSSEGLYVEVVKVFGADLSGVAIGDGGILLGDGVASLLGGDTAGAAYVIMDDNIYAYTDEPNASEAASGVVSMTLFSSTSGDDLIVEHLDAPIMIVIEHAAIANWTNGSTNGSLPGCWYWDEDVEGWSEEGCEVNFNDTSYALSSATQTVCLCNHLTDFNVKTKTVKASAGPVKIELVVNIISAEDISRLFTWDNLMAHPLPFTVVASVWGCFTLSLVFLHLFDRHLDRRAIKDIVRHDPRLTQNSPRGLSSTFRRNGVLQSKLDTFWSVRSLLHRHMWLSVAFRAPTSNLASTGRALCLVVFILGTCTTNAIFFGTDRSMSANAGIIAFSASIIALGPALTLMFCMKYLCYDRQLRFFYKTDTPGYQALVDSFEGADVKRRLRSYRLTKKSCSCLSFGMRVLEVVLPEGLMGVRREYDDQTLSTLVPKPEFHQMGLRDLLLAFEGRPLSERLPLRSVVGWAGGLLYAIAMSFLTLQYGLQFDIANPDDLASVRAITGVASGQDQDVTAAWLKANWRANLIDFILNQPTSILSSFIVLWCFYKLQTTTAKYVTEVSVQPCA